jgi:ketosteroid isomerase-like protein
VEIVRKGVEAWNQRDADLWLTYAAPEIEWMPAGPAAVERAVHRGYAEVASGFESVWQTWEEFRFEESQVRDLGDSVLWLGRVKMRGGASQIELRTLAGGR